MSESLGIAVTNSCYQCQALDSLCPDCDDLKFSRDSYIAHEIVDDGNLQYKHIWSNGDSTVSGHDWVGAVIKLSNRTKRYKVGASMTEDTIREYLIIEEMEDTRKEFLDPITNLVDRLPNDLETSVTVLDYEVLCPSCHLYHHKSLSDCPICY
jgi:hypothetical protein